jgi:hypothetical protein
LENVQKLSKSRSRNLNKLKQYLTNSDNLSDIKLEFKQKTPSDSVNMLLNRLNQLNKPQKSQKSAKISKFEDSNNYSDNEEGNHRLDLIRMPQYNSIEQNTDNFKTIRPSNRELSQYEYSEISPGCEFTSMKHVNFSHLWDRLLKDERRNKP